MGYYIEGPAKGKVEYLKDTYGATETKSPVAPHPLEKVLICVVDNGPFEAACYAHNAREIHDMTIASDLRPKTWLLMDRGVVHRLTKFRG